MNIQETIHTKPAEGNTGSRSESGFKAALKWIIDNSDAILKLTGTLGIVAATLLVSGYESRMSAISLINQREQAESELRASMFSHLITPVAGPYKENAEIDSHRERVLVELLALNFHEHFEFKPLMIHVDKRLADKCVDACPPQISAQAELDRNSLRSIARRVADRQIAMLAKEGSNPPFELEVTFPADRGQVGATPSFYCTQDDFSGIGGGSDGGNQADKGVFARLKAKGIIEPAGTGDYYLFAAENIDQLIASLEKAGLKDETESILLVWHQKQDIRIVEPSVNNVKALSHQFVRLNPPMTASRNHYIELRLHSPDVSNETVDIDYLVNFDDGAATQTKPRQFTLTWYDFPLTDNTMMPDGNRFSIVLSNLEGLPGEAITIRIKIVWYPKGYFTARERPIKYREFRDKLNI
jgi:hypothetical protein